MQPSDLLLDDEDRNRKAGLPAQPDPRRRASDFLLEDEVSNRQRQINTTLDVALPRNPDKAAEAKALAQRFRIDVETATTKLDDLSRIARAQDITQLTKESPVLARQMVDLDFAAVAHDDSKNLVLLERTFTNVMKDIGITGLKGAVALPQAIMGLGDIISGGEIGAGAKALGVDFKRTQDILDESYSDVQKARNLEVSQAQGFWGTVGAAIENPSVIGKTVLESLPQMLGGMALARGLMAFAPKTSALVAGATGEGIMGAGSAANQMQKNQGDDLSLKQSLSALGSGAGTAVFGLLGGKFAQRLGIDDVDTFLARGGFDKAAANNAKTMFVARLGAAGVSEGVFEELPQSAQEQMWQNFATGKPLMEGVPEAAGLGFVAGAVTGGAFEGLRTGLETRNKAAEAAENNAGVLGQLNDLVKASKVMQRDAQTFESFIKQAGQEANVTDVYIDGRVLNQAAVDLGITPEQLPQVVREQLEQAAATGNDVVIPVEVYATQMATQEYAQSLLDHLKVEPRGMSRAEATVFMQERAQEMQEEVTKVISSAQNAEAYKASADAVKSYFDQQLQATGRFRPEVNAAYSTMLSNFYAVTAAKVNMTPEQLLQRYPLRIQAQGVERPAGGQLMEQDGQILYQGEPSVPTGLPSFDTQYTDKTGEAFNITVRQETMGMGADRQLVVMVEARTQDGNRRALANFAVNGNTLASENTMTAGAYKRRGLAEAMYRAAREAGYDIAPGRMQTEDGAGMVESFKAKGIINATSAMNQGPAPSSGAGASDQGASLAFPQILHQAAVERLTSAAERGQRVVGQRASISPEEKAAIKESSDAIGISVAEITRAVRAHKLAHPPAQGWAQLTYVRTTIDDGKVAHKYKITPYTFNSDNNGKKLNPGTPEYTRRVRAVAKAMADEVRTVLRRSKAGDKNASNILAQAGWYKSMRSRLRQEFGGLGDLFADLLGATSPNTPVRDNWANAVDALRRASRGDYDQLMPQWEAWANQVDSLETDLRSWFNGQLESGYTKKAIKEMPEYQAKMDRLKAAKDLPDELLPLKESGKKYGFNGRNVARTMVDLWRIVRNADPDIGRGATAPKAINFSGNLIGFRERATIDVWAARMLQRLSGGVRIPSMAEAGVSGAMLEDGSTTLQFGFGQDVFTDAVALIRNDPEMKASDTLASINDDDLQAVVWFVEKELWTVNDWTSVDGEGGSFELEANLTGTNQIERVRELRRIINSTKSTEQEIAQATAELATLERTVDRFVAGMSIQTSSGLQGEAYVPTDADMAQLSNEMRAAIYEADDGSTVLASKAMTTEGRYGTVERSLDMEIVAREGFDPRPVWLKMLQRGMETNQDSVFLSRVLRPDEDVDVSRHRPGVEIYFRDASSQAQLEAILNDLKKEGVSFYTVIVDGRRATEYVSGAMPPAVGVRLQFVPEFLQRYGDEDLKKLDDVALGARIQQEAIRLEALATRVAASIDGVSFAGQFWYDTHVAFAHEYQEKIDGLTAGDVEAVAGQGGSPGWSGQPIRAGLESADRQAREAALGEPDDADVLGQDGEGAGRDRGDGRRPSRGLAPLEGSPSVPGFHGPDPRLVEVAEQYAAANGIAYARQGIYVDVDEARAKRIAQAYEEMAHAPNDPVVREAYDNLIRQTRAQYDALVAAGYRFWFMDMSQEDNQQYAASPWNAMRDIRANKTMGVFPTNDGFGTSDDFDPDQNPLLGDTGLMWPVGGPGSTKMMPVLANDLFRAVHDAFGHGLEGSGFRARGEENAWQAHARLFTGSALAALTSETRGQNSWLNYGPHGEKNRTAPVEETIFADQKTGLMPEWTWQEGIAPDAEPEAGDTVVYNQFAGVVSQTANQDAYNEFLRREKDGQIQESIRRVTGWFRGPDGVARYEIADDEAGWVDRKPVDSAAIEADVLANMTLKLDDKTPGIWKATYKEGTPEHMATFGRSVGDAQRALIRIFVSKAEKAGATFNISDIKGGEEFVLADVLNHPKLFAAYPMLANYKLRFERANGINGSYDSSINYFTVSLRDSKERMLSTLLHEVQHAIQDIEGFATGGSTDPDFIAAVRKGIDQMASMERQAVERWRWQNDKAYTEAERAGQMVQYALMYDSVEKLFSYAGKDAPSSVFRLIRNEIQWIYGKEFYNNEEARELQRAFYAIPKAHKKAERNAAIRDIAFRGAQLLREQIPIELRMQFDADTRTTKSLINAMRREAEKARKKLEPLNELQGKAKAAEDLAKAHQISDSFEIYRSLAGEIEARNTQARMLLSEAERQAQPPEVTADVPSSNAIVLFGGLKVHAPRVAFSADKPPVGSAQPDAPQPRGQIALGQDITKTPSVITLFEAADLSTLLHESGHFFLEVQLDLAARIAGEAQALGADTNNPAEQQLVQDANALMRWFGLQTLDEWFTLPPDQRTVYHEKFARGFEAYLFEGNSPNVEIQSLFQRFRSWLLNIYQQIKNLDVKLDDEVRGVMDRMLATNEQIEIAQAARSMQPLFASAQQAGMTPEEFAAYQELGAYATQTAIDQLQTAALRDMAYTRNAKNREIKKLQKQAATERSKLRIEARREVMSRPIYQAWQYLTGTAENGEAGTNKLFVVANPGVSDADAEVLKKRKMLSTNGMEPDVALDMIPGLAGQFASGAELVRALVTAEPPNAVIDAMVDQMMLERFGELATPEAIDEAADRAVYNDARARFVASELNAIRVATGKPKILAQAAKDFAAQMIAKLEIRNIKPHVYSAAESKASRAAAKAFKTGDIEQAAVEKRNQLVNAYAAKIAADGVNEVQKGLQYFRKVVRFGDKKLVQKGVDPDVANVAKVILAEYGIGERAGERAADYLEVVRKNNPEMFAILQPTIEAAMLNAKPMAEMTLEEFRGLRDEIQALMHLAKRSRMMEVAGNLLDRQEVLEELQAQLEAVGIPPVIPGELSAVTPAEQAKRKLQYATALLRRVEQWAEGMDRGFGGPFLRYIFQPIKDAADRYRADRAVYRRQYLALIEAVAPTMKARVIEAPELGYTFGMGHNGVGMAELLHAILHTGNDSNKRKLLLGRGWAKDVGDGQLDTSKWDAFIDRMHREGVLTKVHYDFAQGVWDLLDSMKPLAQKAHRDVFGRYFEEVTANSLDTPFGVYRGGYVPAQADPAIVTDASLRELAEQENQNMAYSFPTTSKGFTKSRVEYNRPLKLDLRSLSQHIDKVLLFAHLEPHVRDVNRLISDREFGKNLGRVDPTAVDGMLAPWLKRAATQQVETPITGDGGMSRLLSTIRSRAGMALMFGNISNTLQQITGLPGAAIKVRPSLLLKATADYVSSPRKMAKNVADLSIYMKDRMENEIAAINNQMSEILLDPTLYERAQAWTIKHSYFLQTAMDNVVGPIVWTGAYNQAIEQGMADEDAVRFADGVIRQTQGTTLPEDVSRIETGPAYARLFTQFIGYFNMLANTNGTELQKIAKTVGLRNGAGRAIGVVFMGLLAPAWIAEAIAIAMRGGPDDEDEDGWYLDDWLSQVVMLGSVKFALAGIPFVGQVANAGINRFNGNPVDDRVSLSPAVSLIEGSVGAPASIYKALVEDGNKAKAVKDVGTAVSIMTGLPAHWAARPISYLVGVGEERITPTGPLDFGRGLLTGTASPESKQ